MQKEIKRGDIYIVDLPSTGNSIQNGFGRPMIICSNNIANLHSPILHVIPLTTRKKPSLPTHTEIDTSSGIYKKSVALCEQVMPIPKTSIKEFIGFCNIEMMDRVDFCLSIHLGLVDLVKRNKYAYA